MVALKKSETVNLRIDAATRDIISRAAAMSGKSMTAFMTEAALSVAQRELLDQRFIGVDATVFDGLDAVLSAPGKADARLVDLLKSDEKWID